MLFPKRNKITEQKMKFDKNYKFIGTDCMKPRGFWYACGSEWYDSGIHADSYKYLYSVKLKRSILTKNLSDIKKGKVLQITKKDEMKAFDKKYGFDKKYSVDRGRGIQKCREINWKQVQKDFVGIEICPFQKKSKYGLNGEIAGKVKVWFWYTPWDVASGCIWDLNAIDNVELKHTFTEEEINRVR